MKNITLTVPEELIEAARKLPEVQRTSLSSYVAQLLRKDLERQPEQKAEQLLKAFEEAAATATTTWTWNRDEIYSR